MDSLYALFELSCVYSVHQVLLDFMVEKLWALLASNPECVGMVLGS